jgi:hypothetical protein
LPPTVSIWNWNNWNCKFPFLNSQEISWRHSGLFIIVLFKVSCIKPCISFQGNVFRQPFIFVVCNFWSFSGNVSSTINSSEFYWPTQNLKTTFVQTFLSTESKF